MDKYEELYENLTGNLAKLPQYSLPREEFCEIFSDVDNVIWDKCDFDIQANHFRFWKHSDELFILHEDSGTMVNWYKNLGRINTCNKNLTKDEYRMFARLFLIDLIDYFN